MRNRCWGLCIPGALVLGLIGCMEGPADRQVDPAEPMDPAFEALLSPEVLVTGAALSGANGLRVGPDGLLYVASVIGSEIVVMDPRDGAVVRRLTAMDGVHGPDDVAFAPDGAVYWTSILTGEVAGYTVDGTRRVAAMLGPGVNPLAFADDGRLFVAQCFFGDGVFEVDPAGGAPPRLIADDLGPGCGLNGMDWGPDRRLYGPRWFHGEVVSLDVETGAWQVQATGLKVPAAVKFDSRGRLHVLDTATGQILRVDEDALVAVVELEPGLDNFAFDVRDQMFVSSFADGSVRRIESDGSTVTLAVGGMAHPGGVAVRDTGSGVEVIVADLHTLRGYDGDSGAPTFVARNILGVGDLGSVLAVAADGDTLILTSFTDNAVRVWDPVAQQVIARYDGLAQPVSALRYRGELIVAEHGLGRVIAVSETGIRVVADGLPAPTGLATDGVSLYVSDRERGRIFEIARDGEVIAPRRVVKGLEAPEGLAVHEGRLLVVEGETGRIYRVEDDALVLLALVAPGTPPASMFQPPSMIFNGLAVAGDSLYVTGETNRVLYRIDLTQAGRGQPASVTALAVPDFEGR
jgi:sugar lactone lactonase YvrE